MFGSMFIETPSCLSFFRKSVHPTPLGIRCHRCEVPGSISGYVTAGISAQAAELHNSLASSNGTCVSFRVSYCCVARGKPCINFKSSSGNWRVFTIGQSLKAFSSVATHFPRAGHRRAHAVATAAAQLVQACSSGERRARSRPPRVRRVS